MYEHFTNHARQVMMVANQEARRLGQEYIGTEHILLGLTAASTGLAALLFKEFRIDPHAVRAEIERVIVAGPDVPPLKPPQTRKIIENAIEAANLLGHCYVGTEHLILGVLRNQDCLAAQLLRDLGMNPGVGTAAMLRILGEDFIQGPAESIPMADYNDLPPEERDVIHRLNHEIGRLHWTNE